MKAVARRGAVKRETVKAKSLSPALLAKLKRLAHENRTPQWWYESDEDPTKPAKK